LYFFLIVNANRILSAKFLFTAIMTIQQDLPSLPAVRAGGGAQENGTQRRDSLVFPPPPVKTLGTYIPPISNK
jgi:hypothetical protein